MRLLTVKIVTLLSLLFIPLVGGSNRAFGGYVSYDNSEAEFKPVQASILKTLETWGILLNALPIII